MTVTQLRDKLNELIEQGHGELPMTCEDTELNKVTLRNSDPNPIYHSVDLDW